MRARRATRAPGPVPVPSCRRPLGRHLSNPLPNAGLPDPPKGGCQAFALGSPRHLSMVLGIGRTPVRATRQQVSTRSSAPRSAPPASSTVASNSSTMPRPCMERIGRARRALAAQGPGLPEPLHHRGVHVPRPGSARRDFAHKPGGRSQSGPWPLLMPCIATLATARLAAPTMTAGGGVGTATRGYCTHRWHPRGRRLVGNSARPILGVPGNAPWSRGTRRRPASTAAGTLPGRVRGQ